jgi:hypothetical protein
MVTYRGDGLIEECAGGCVYIYFSMNVLPFSYDFT